MEYLETFPKLYYDIKGDGNLKLITDILRRFKVRNSIQEDAVMFDKYEVKDGGEVRNFRHSFPISHLLQTGKLNELKNGLVEGAEDNWLRILQADRFLYKSRVFVAYTLTGNYDEKNNLFL